MCFYSFAASAVELNDVLHSPSAAVEWSFDRDNIFPFLHGLTLLLLINISVINLLWHKAFQPPTQPARQFDSSPKATFRLQVANTDGRMPSNNPHVVFLSLFCLSAAFLSSFLSHIWAFFLQGLVGKVCRHPNRCLGWVVQMRTADALTLHFGPVLLTLLNCTLLYSNWKQFG